MNKEKIANRLEQLSGRIAMFADGFIDEQWSLVDSRLSYDKVNLIGKMTRFADRINAVGTGGMGIELIKKRMVFGGFTANIGFAAASLGIETVMAGLFGEGDLDPVFEPIYKIAEMITLGKPSITHAFEFDDGKILLTDMEAVLGMRWDWIADTLGMEKIVKILTDADIVGVGYWSLMPAFDEIVSELCAAMPQDGKKRRFFFDLADVSRRDRDSLAHTMTGLSYLNGEHPMTLSVNEHEGAVLFDIYGEDFSKHEKAESVRKKAGLDELVIHTPHFASAASAADGFAMIPQEYVEKPVRTAGAGDTFNGGYIAATLAGLDIQERLHTANSAVSFFLNNGRAPSRKELMERINS